ncbi:urease accessory protein UreF [Occultella gossypii]|uniref:Urease accessory protein UreF n=1 Tax=Occultella gossypii TaxID=2800820 RepID=A0ABS7SBX3_9MICO|nr:urease accessory UreF family protein [Occultella gossypii]MBZ2197856.1 urease accessory protein [Occultella gossypii]
MTAELGVLLLADARLPTGGHAHSGGLEPALAAGLTAAQVPDYITTRLRTVGLVEAAAAVLALRSARTDPDRLGAVQEALTARTPSAPQRHASGLLGRGLVRLAERLWPENPAVRALGGLGLAPLRPVVLGVVAAAVGMDEVQVARASLYDDAQTVAAAALKLLPVDPTEATRWLLRAEPTMTDIITRAIRVTCPDDLPAVTAPLIEQWSLEHHGRTRRIFVA